MYPMIRGSFMTTSFLLFMFFQSDITEGKEDVLFLYFCTDN